MEASSSLAVRRIFLDAPRSVVTAVVASRAAELGNGGPDFWRHLGAVHIFLFFHEYHHSLAPACSSFSAPAAPIKKRSGDFLQLLARLFLEVGLDFGRQLPRPWPRRVAGDIVFDGVDGLAVIII